MNLNFLDIGVAKRKILRNLDGCGRCFKTLLLKNAEAQIKPELLLVSDFIFACSFQHSL